MLNFQTGGRGGGGSGRPSSGPGRQPAHGGGGRGFGGGGRGGGRGRGGSDGGRAPRAGGRGGFSDGGRGRGFGGRGGFGGGRGSTLRGEKRKRSRESEWGDEGAEAEALEAAALAQAPAPGTLPEFTTSAESANQTNIAFSALPLSKRSLRGLAECGFEYATAVQATTLPHALAGRDVLASARTGSGKTLAFALPALELLHRKRWSIPDGLGALLVAPTRELALQTFEVMRAVGKYHALSAGVVTGGKKDFGLEQARIGAMCVVVGTPGRLLQHLEQTSSFDASTLLLFTLDEADRLLDMGFSETLASIVSYLPPPQARQTLLFSATVSKSVRKLARKHLRDGAEHAAVSAGETAAGADADKVADAEAGLATPANLKQHYTECALGDKLNVLYSFIKTHMRSKCIAFFSTCAQVRHAHSVLCAMQPGISLLALHGKVKQQRRTAVYYDFARKEAAILLATDLAARGLDFPEVDWVVQVDAPDDADAYVHRVGRTARYKRGGRALLLLAPGEVPSVPDALAKARVPLGKIAINPNKTVSVTRAAASLAAENTELRALATRAFVSHVRALALSPGGGLGGGGMDHSDAALAGFAESLGLPTVPPLDFLNSIGDRAQASKKKNVNRKLERLKEKIKIEKARKKAGLATGDDLAVAKEAKAAKRHAKAGPAGVNEADDFDGDDNYTRPMDRPQSDSDSDSDSGSDSSGSGSDSDSDSGGDGGMALGSGSDSDDLHRPLAPASDSDSDSDSDAGSDQGGMFTVKQTHAWGAGGADGDSSDGEIERVLTKSQKRKLKRVKIDTQGVDKHARGTKTVFDADGTAVDDPSTKFGASPFDGSVQPEDVDTGGTAHAEHVARVRARLAAGKVADDESHRERLKSKRQKHREIVKGPLPESGSESDGDEGVQLGGYSDASMSDGEGSGSGSESGGDGSASASGSESDAPAGEPVDFQKQAMELLGMA